MKINPLTWIRNSFLFGVLFFGVTFPLCIFLMLRSAAKEAESNRDVVIVLGCGIKGDRVSLTLADRLDTSLVYANENPESVIIVTGGQGPGESVTEAYAMKNYLISKGLSPERILTEEKSTSTKENLQFSKTILDEYFNGNEYTSVIVSNDFHIFRALNFSKKAGLDAQGLTCPTRRHLVPSLYMREYLSIILHFFLTPAAF